MVVVSTAISVWSPPRGPSTRSPPFPFPFPFFFTTLHHHHTPSPAMSATPETLTRREKRRVFCESREKLCPTAFPPPKGTTTKGEEEGEGVTGAPLNREEGGGMAEPVATPRAPWLPQ